MRKNKYNLMGQYVEVKAYMKPAKKFNARDYEKKVLKEPRIGMVVGYRTVYGGKIMPGTSASAYFESEYSPAWFKTEKTIQVILVCFWPRYKPVLVLQEDIMVPWVPRGAVVTKILHPTVHKWSDKDKEYLSKEMKTFPRDEKGRWKK